MLTYSPSYLNTTRGENKFFLKNWEKITRDREILNIVQGWEIPLLSPPIQTKPPNKISFSEQEKKVISAEISKMLKREPFRKCPHPNTNSYPISS